MAKYVTCYASYVHPKLGGQIVEILCRNSVIRAPDHLRPLADLLVDPEPQVRYVGACFLKFAIGCRHERDLKEIVEQSPEIEDRLYAAAEDDIAFVASVATWLLGLIGDDSDTAFFISRLRAGKHNDLICQSVLRALSQIGDTDTGKNQKARKKPIPRPRKSRFCRCDRILNRT
ncbi:hypothetical protein QUF72_07945 [Desulfobacterales bacterium HSG2]|nr:hypothetical protein [Desulfobacterales bacterium HSG2]